MKAVEILLIKGKDKNNSSLLNKPDQEESWNITVVTSDECAIEQFYLKPFDIVIMDENTDEQMAKKLMAIIHVHSSDILIIKQKDNNLSALKAKIKNLWNAKKLERLQRIKVNDTLNVKNLRDEIQEIPPL